MRNVPQLVRVTYAEFKMRCSLPVPPWCSSTRHYVTRRPEVDMASWDWLAQERRDCNQTTGVFSLSGTISCCLDFSLSRFPISVSLASISPENHSPDVRGYLAGGPLSSSSRKLSEFRPRRFEDAFSVALALGYLLTYCCLFLFLS